MSEAVLIAPESIEQIVALVVARMPAPPAAMPELLTSEQVMRLLGYSETEPLLAAARKAKCPMIRINARKILFDPTDVAAWLQRLKETGPEMRIRIESGSPLQQRRRRAGR